MSENSAKPKKNASGVFVIVILILLCFSGYLFYVISGKNKDIERLTNLNNDLNKDMEMMNSMLSERVGGSMTNDLQNDFKNMMNVYDALIEKDSTKSDSLNMQKEKIKNLMGEMDQLKRNGRLSAREIARLKRETETLRGIMKGYIEQIDKLNTLNLKLTADLETTTSNLNQTTAERDQYKDEAQKSADQVKKGSRLSAYSFSSVGLKMKINNMPEETNKAKNCVQIRSSFTIGENAIASPGRKVVYMQIINPEGRTLQTKSSYTVKTDLGEIAYSDKKEIDYNNQSIDLSIFYDLNGEEAVKGNYKVKIYCDGQLIGSDSFTLK